MPNKYAKRFLEMFHAAVAEKGETMSEFLERIERNKKVTFWILPYKEWYISRDGELRYSYRVYDIAAEEQPQTLIEKAEKQSNAKKAELEKELSVTQPETETTTDDSELF